MLRSVPWTGPPLFSCFQAKPLLACRKASDSAVTSLDLGISTVSAHLDREGVSIPLDGGLQLSWKALEAIAKEERKVFRLDTAEPEPVRVFSEATGWVRSLCPTSTAPTVLVSGIPMHRIKDTDPMADTRAKLRALGSPRGNVLDTATGLGYTAIEASKTARHVLTVELDPGALEIARLNPWSADLFDNPKIEQRIGDVAEVVRDLPAASFEAILHDPPTMALGGDLYGSEFYRELRRVLKRGGRLFHYIGDPDSGLGAKTYPGVMRRLSENGFENVRRQPEAFGVTAQAR